MPVVEDCYFLFSFSYFMKALYLCYVAVMVPLHCCNKQMLKDEKNYILENYLQKSYLKKGKLIYSFQTNFVRSIGFFCSFR